MNTANKNTVHLYAPDSGQWVSNINGAYELDVRPNVKRAMPDVRTARYVSRTLRKEQGIITHVVLL